MKFKFDYDEENDDLFVYSEKKSSGAVELGNFVLDFDEDGNLVAMQITNASEILSKIVSSIIEMNEINQIEVEVINFRNMNGIKFHVVTSAGKYSANILIPHIIEKSPVLKY